jgi:hypothetical protein
MGGRGGGGGEYTGGLTSSKYDKYRTTGWLCDCVFSPGVPGDAWGIFSSWMHSMMSSSSVDDDAEAASLPVVTSPGVEGEEGSLAEEEENCTLSS